MASAWLGDTSSVSNLHLEGSQQFDSSDVFDADVTGSPSEISRGGSGACNSSELQLESVPGPQSTDGDIPNRGAGLHDSEADADRELSSPTWCLKSSGKYLCFHQKLMLIILSIIVGFVAILVQHALDSENRRSSVSLRPGWARHRSEGWDYMRGR